MTVQPPLAAALSPARYSVYLDATNQDNVAATELYQWGVQLAGAWHAHLSYVEIFVRNAVDTQLRAWNSAQTDGVRPLSWEWTADREAGEDVYKLLGKSLNEARGYAERAANGRPTGHPRRGATPTHDDVLTQLTFGSWSRLLRFPGSPRPNARHKTLWRQGLNQAFPHGPQNETGLVWAGHVMESLRTLRNRVAHHDNLLSVDTTTRLRESLALLSRIDPSYPGVVMARSSLRHIAAQDPRLP